MILTVGFCVAAITVLQLRVQLLPLLVEEFPVVVVLLDGEDLLLLGVHAERLLEGERVNLFEDGLQCDQ